MTYKWSYHAELILSIQQMIPVGSQRSEQNPFSLAIDDGGSFLELDRGGVAFRAGHAGSMQKIGI